MYIITNYFHKLSATSLSLSFSEYVIIIVCVSVIRSWIEDETIVPFVAKLFYIVGSGSL